MKRPDLKRLYSERLVTAAKVLYFSTSILTTS